MLRFLTMLCCSVQCLQFVSKTRLFFTCSHDGTIKQWDADSFELIVTLQVCLLTADCRGWSAWHRLPFLACFTCLICYIMCLIVVSVYTIINLWHWISLVPLFGSVYITVLNCVCYVMFMWWFVLYFMHCSAWQVLCNPAFILQYE